MGPNEAIRGHEEKDLSQLNQGSADWLSWRSKGIGASDVAPLMGFTRYKSLFQLWAEKTGIAEPFAGNEHTRRGNLLEPLVRDRYNLENMCNLQPALFEYKEWPILRASLDGIDSIGKHILEIKCPLGKDHETAMGGKIPEQYVYQIQTQLLVSGAVSGDYVSYRDGDLRIVGFTKDKEIQDKILEAAKAFWVFVETNTQPEGAPVELENMDGDATLTGLLALWSELTEKEKQIEIEKEVLKNAIDTRLTGKSAICNGFKVKYSERKGHIDYARASEENFTDFDFEAYRKPGSRVMQITKAKVR